MVGVTQEVLLVGKAGAMPQLLASGTATGMAGKGEVFGN